MTEALLVSNLVLWVMVIALSALVLALLRQVGVLHERIARAGALATAATWKRGCLATAVQPHRMLAVT